MLTHLPIHSLQVKTSALYLFRSWVITLPKFSSCLLVVTRKEGKELITFQTWNKIMKIFYWLYGHYFLRNRNNERGGNWYNCQLPQLPIGGFVSGPHSDEATDCPLFVSRARPARSLALFIVTINSHPICRDIRQIWTKSDYSEVICSSKYQKQQRIFCSLRLYEKWRCRARED